MGNSTNNNLHNAKEAKQDEFYTTMDSVSAEVKYYRKHFKDAVVLCNCDDPFESEFFKYFALNFNRLGLKRLIATCYKGSPFIGTQMSWIDGYEASFEFNGDVNRKAYKIVINEVPDVNGDGAVDITDVEWLLKHGDNVLTELKGDGDFRSDECIELMDEATIVCTNPPFSLFREYINLLVEKNKKFLIIGSQNNITYKDVFPLLKDNKVWLGHKSGDMAFRVPASYEPRETRYWEDESGQKWRSLGNICWYTNLDHNKRHEELDLYKKYDPEEYPRYDNYDAIEVSKVSDIPRDYYGVMGVPITFMDKYSPEQFEVLGLTTGRDEFGKEAWPTKRYENALQVNRDGSVTSGSKANTRATLLLKEVPTGRIYYTADNADGPMSICYARILIRRKDNS